MESPAATTENPLEENEPTANDSNNELPFEDNDTANDTQEENDELIRGTPIPEGCTLRELVPLVLIVQTICGAFPVFVNTQFY